MFQGNACAPYTVIPPQERPAAGKGPAKHAKLADWVWRYFTEPGFGFEEAQVSFGGATTSGSAPAPVRCQMLPT